MNLKDCLKGIRVELVDLNMLTYFYVRKANRLKFLFQETTRRYVLEELTSMRYMENGLILHLTKLDDERANFSYQKVLKILNKTSEEKELLKIVAPKIKGYRQKVNYLKNSHRNSRIAHLNSLEYPNYDEFLIFEEKLKPLVLQANDIADKLFKKKLEYKFRLGSIEGYMDFRNSLEDYIINFEEIEDFS